MKRVAKIGKEFITSRFRKTNKQTNKRESIEGCLFHHFILQKFLFFPFKPVKLAILSYTVLLDKSWNDKYSSSSTSEPEVYHKEMLLSLLSIYQRHYLTVIRCFSSSEENCFWHEELGVTSETNIWHFLVSIMPCQYSFINIHEVLHTERIKRNTNDRVFTEWMSHARICTAVKFGDSCQ